MVSLEFVGPLSQVAERQVELVVGSHLQPSSGPSPAGDALDVLN